LKQVNVRIASAITASWLLIALVLASQTVFASNLQGNPTAFAGALRTALMQTVPWIPVTLAVIWLAGRFPVTRATLRTALPIHLVAFLAVAFVENLLVVVQFYIIQRRFPGVVPMLASAAQWGMIRLHIAALVYVAIAAATQAIAYYRAARARELSMARLEGQLARARLDALTAQIRPHFLFNTLHTIGHLWRSGRAEEADAMLDHLGALFQRVQQTTSRPIVSLDEELETVAAYLAIEAVRFRDRMRVAIDVPDDARACAVPPLLLQPIVENAVRHGIAVSSKAGEIRVSARLYNGTLRLDVEDDGPGVTEGAAPRGSGTGLANTRARLAEMFGGNQQLEIASRNGTGTRVSITIPARSADEAEVRDA
jgi:two-component system LytT family sensor kinase